MAGIPDPAKLKEMDPQWIQPISCGLFTAERNTGKTVAMSYILSLIGHYYTTIRTFNATEKGNRSGQAFTPYTSVYPLLDKNAAEYGLEAMERARGLREISGRRTPQKYHLEIFDDVVEDSAVLKDGLFRAIMKRGRHAHMGAWITTQDCLDMPQDLRDNLDFVMAAGDTTIKLERLWSNYFQTVEPDFEKFQRLYRWTTSRRGFLVRFKGKTKSGRSKVRLFALFVPPEFVRRIEKLEKRRTAESNPMTSLVAKVGNPVFHLLSEYVRKTAEQEYSLDMDSIEQGIRYRYEAGRTGRQRFAKGSGGGGGFGGKGGFAGNKTPAAAAGTAVEFVPKQSSAVHRPYRGGAVAPSPIDPVPRLQAYGTAFKLPQGLQPTGLATHNRGFRALPPETSWGHRQARQSTGTAGDTSKHYSRKAGSHSASSRSKGSVRQHRYRRFAAARHSHNKGSSWRGYTGGHGNR